MNTEITNVYGLPPSHWSSKKAWEILLIELFLNNSRKVGYTLNPTLYRDIDRNGQLYFCANLDKVKFKFHLTIDANDLACKVFLSPPYTYVEKKLIGWIPFSSITQDGISSVDLDFTCLDILEIGEE